MFVCFPLQSSSAPVVTLKGMNNTDQTKVTVVQSVLAKRATPKLEELIHVFLSFLHKCVFGSFWKCGEIMV